MMNHEGRHVPEFSFRGRRDGAWKDRSTADVFDGRTVVVFALPGAFTPTCSSAHVPRYEELADSFSALGVDELVCVAVNDAFVLDAWKAAEHAEHVTFLADGTGEFTEAMGGLVDKGELGRRSARYSMLVRNAVIEKMFIEADVPGDPFLVSDADTMLAWLGGVAPPDVLLVTREGCQHCARARRAMADHHQPYAELPSSPRILRALPGAGTTPQVFVDGVHLGGADELVAWLDHFSRPSVAGAQVPVER